MELRETAQWLMERDNYLILTHKRPDGDTIGSAAGLCALLRGLGKTAWVLDSEDATPQLRSYLAGYIAPEGFQPDTVVSVDVADAKLLPENAAPYLSSIHLAIDHHASHRPYAEERWVEGSWASCGELVWELCKELGVTSPDTASPLYAAVATDCGCFVYANTTPHTHRAAAELMECGAPWQAINKRHFRTKTIPRLKLEGQMLSAVELLYDGTLAVACVPLSMMEEAGATREDTEDLSSLPGVIKGALGSVTIREQPDGECKISLRTYAHWLDANRVCARLGGGGHPAAAGCTFIGTVEEAKAAVLAAVDAQFAAQEG